MKAETRVGRYVVPIKNYKYPSIVTFSSGAHGKREAGEYAFWTAVLKKRMVVSGTKKKSGGVFGRARLILPPGERFCRMKGKKLYRSTWIGLLQAGKNVKFVRPSTKREIYSWAKTHSTDWKHVDVVKIAGVSHEMPKDLHIVAMGAISGVR